jgi:cytochrome c
LERNGARVAWTALTAGLLLCPAGAGHAQPKPDLELGRYLAAECMTCHRTATATSTIPNIFGLPEQHMVDVMKAYRDKKLPNPVMQTIASRLSEEDIVSLAVFFAITKKP